MLFVLLFDLRLFLSFSSFSSCLGRDVACAVRTFVRFALVWFCLPSSSWCLGRAAVFMCSLFFKGSPFLLLFYCTIAVVVPCGARKKFPCTSS